MKCMRSFIETAYKITKRVTLIIAIYKFTHFFILLFTVIKINIIIIFKKWNNHWQDKGLYNTKNKKKIRRIYKRKA